MSRHELCTRNVRIARISLDSLPSRASNECRFPPDLAGILEELGVIPGHHLWHATLIRAVRGCFAASSPRSITSARSIARLFGNE